ncbi:Abi family protein [Aliivibrio fischeri]
MTTAPLVPYKKPYLSSSQLCKKLIDQGLIIDDEDFAEKVLNRCSYYRFKAYLSPFKDKGTKKFSEHTTFHNGYELYMFDSELRSYIFDIIEKVEIGVRSALDQWITKQTDNPFWYLDASLFKSNGQQVKTVSRVRDMFVDSKEEYAKHYQEKYYNEYCPFYRDLPPAWVAIELMTFGNVVKLIQNISDDKIQSLKMDRFSKKFNIQKFQTLISWMNVLHQMRNYCGHHNRLFNRNFPAPTAIKKSLHPF